MKRPREHSREKSLPQKAAKIFHHGSDQMTLNAKLPASIPGARIAGYDSSKQLPKIREDKLPSLPSISDELAARVFTHSSTVDAKYGTQNQMTYERLEFLGDAYIELIATRLIYSRLPELLAGDQSSLREKMVCNKTLAKFSRRYSFDKKLRMAKNHKSKEKAFEKIVADVFEAYVAAIVLNSTEHGFEKAEEWLTELWAPILTGEAAHTEIASQDIDAKSVLARMLQSKGVSLVYKDEELPTTTPTTQPREQQFCKAVYLNGWGYQSKFLGKGVGCGKTRAGMLAAKDALDNNAHFIQELVEIKRVSDEKRRAEAEARNVEETQKAATTANAETA